MTMIDALMKLRVAMSNDGENLLLRLTSNLTEFTTIDELSEHLANYAYRPLAEDYNWDRYGVYVVKGGWRDSYEYTSGKAKVF